MLRATFEFVSIHTYGESWVVRTRRVPGSFETFWQVFGNEPPPSESRAFYVRESPGKVYTVIQSFPNAEFIPERVKDQVLRMWRMHLHTATPLPAQEKPDVIPFEDVA